MQADLVIVVARTATDPDNRRKGLTLIVVEDGMEGFTRGRDFSASVYPASWITSIRSRNGPGIVSSVFAVVTNITSERSNGRSR